MPTPGATSEQGRALHPADQLLPRVEDKVEAATHVVSKAALQQGQEFTRQGRSGLEAVSERVNDEWRAQRSQEAAWQGRNQAVESQINPQTSAQEAQRLRQQEFEQQRTDWAAHLAGSNPTEVGNANIWQDEQAMQNDPILRRLGFNPVPGATTQQQLAEWLQTEFYSNYCQEGNQGTQNLVNRLMLHATVEPNNPNNIDTIRGIIKDSQFLQAIYGGEQNVLYDALRLATEMHARTSVFNLSDNDLRAAVQNTQIEDRTAQGGINEPAVFALLEGRPLSGPEIQQQNVIDMVHERLTSIQADRLYRNVRFDQTPTDNNDFRFDHFLHNGPQITQLSAEQQRDLMLTTIPVAQESILNEAVLYGGTTDQERARALLAADRVILRAFGDNETEQNTAFENFLTNLNNSPRNPTGTLSLLQDLVKSNIFEFKLNNPQEFANEADLQTALQSNDGSVVIRKAIDQHAPQAFIGNEDMISIRVNGIQIFLEIDTDATTQRWVQDHARISQSLQQGTISRADQGVVDLWGEAVDHDELWNILGGTEPAQQQEVLPSAQLVVDLDGLVSNVRTTTNGPVDLNIPPLPNTARDTYFRETPLKHFVQIQNPETLLVGDQPLRLPGTQDPNRWRTNPNIVSFIGALEGELNGNQAPITLEQDLNTTILESFYDTGSSLALAAAVYGGRNGESRAQYLLNAYNLVLQAYGQDETQRRAAFRAMLEAQQNHTMAVNEGGNNIRQHPVLTAVYLQNEVLRLHGLGLRTPLSWMNTPERNFVLRLDPGNPTDLVHQRAFTFPSGEGYHAEIDIPATIDLWNSRFATIQQRIQSGQLTPEDARQLTIWSDGVKQDEIVKALHDAVS